MLSEKSRLRKALRREAVDRPPCVCPGGMMNMITGELMDASGHFWPAAHTDPQIMANLATAAYEERFFENYGLPFCMTVEAEALGAKVDLGSKLCEPHVREYAIASVSEADRLSRLDFGSGRLKVVLDAIRLLKKRGTEVPVIGNITGPVSVASSVLDPVILYKELRRKPEDAHKLMDFIASELLAFALRQAEAGADVIAVSDPSGTGEILGPKLFEEFALPALNLVGAGLRERFPDTPCIVHICGKMHKVLGLLERIRCDALSFDAVVSMREARRKIGSKALMGNISTFALESGTPGKIAALTRHCVKCGVDVISPACGLGTSSPSANIRSILKTLRDDCRAGGEGVSI